MDKNTTLFQPFLNSTSTWVSKCQNFKHLCHEACPEFFKHESQQSPSTVYREHPSQSVALVKPKYQKWLQYPQNDKTHFPTIALLLPITSGETCETLHESSQLELEAFLWTIDSINSASEDLNGLKLSGLVVDTCQRSKNLVTLESKASKRQDNNNMIPSLKLDQIYTVINSDRRDNMISNQSIVTFLNLESGQDKSPYSLQMSPDLSDYDQALVKILQKSNVSQISVVYNSDNIDSLQRMLQFDQLSSKSGLCIEESWALGQDFDESSVKSLYNKMTSKNVKILVILTTSKIAERIISIFGDFPSKNNIVFAGNFNFEGDHARKSLGSLSIRQYSGNLDPFWTHFSKLKLGENAKNPFFDTFWRQKFHCDQNNQGKKCPNFQLERPQNFDETKLINLINSVWLSAAGLIKLGQELCPEMEQQNLHILQCEKLTRNASKIRQEIFASLKDSSINSIDNGNDLISIAENRKIDVPIKILNLLKDEKDNLYYELVKLIFARLQ